MAIKCRTNNEEDDVIVEVIGGAEERPEARVVDIDDLGGLHLALGEVTDEEAAEVLERAGLGRFQDSETAFLDVAALRAAAEPRASGPDWSAHWDAMIARARSRGGCPTTGRASRCPWRAPPAPDGPAPRPRLRRIWPRSLWSVHRRAKMSRCV